MAPRKPKGTGTIYRNREGLWVGSIELPSYGGKRRRKTVKSKDPRELEKKIRAVKNELALRGDLPTQDQTVEQWFTYWFDRVVSKELRPSTASGYRSVVFGHVIEEIGKTKLDKVTPAHLRRVHDRITVEKGLSSTYALNAHRIMSSAFEEAVREGRMGRNPAKLMRAPRRRLPKLDTLTLEEGIAVLERLQRRPLDGAQRAASLLMGGRRGEVIGLERDRVSDVLDISWQLQRITWSHGCVAAGAKARCGALRGVDCPDRLLRVPSDYEYRHLVGGLYLTRPKSRAGWRIIPLVDPLRSLLAKHLDASPPNPWGLVFTWNQRPIDPDQDSARWKQTLKEVGITKDVRLHDLRHTTVDLLYLAGVPEDVIIEIIGHSTRATTRGYKALQNRERLLRAMTQLSELVTTPRGQTLELGQGRPGT